MSTGTEGEVVEGTAGCGRGGVVEQDQLDERRPGQQLILCRAAVTLTSPSLN